MTGRGRVKKKPEKKIAVYEKIEEFGWLVVSSAYIDEVMRPVWVARLVSHLSMVLLLLGSWAISYYLSGRITRPVDEMTKQLDRNARGGSLARFQLLGTTNWGDWRKSSILSWR